MEKKKVFDEFNILKGIAIILVVLGHSFPDYGIGTGIKERVNIYTFAYIYSFHMPLFFMISGFLFYNSINRINTIKDRFNLIKNRFVRLFIPYLFYSVLTVVMKIAFSTYAQHEFNLKDSYKILLGDNPNGGLWFLYVLFIISLIISLLPKKKICYIITFISSYIVLFTVKDFMNYVTLYRIVNHIPFFIFGMFVFDYYDSFKKMFKGNVLVMLLLGSFVALDVGYAGNISYYSVIIAYSGILVTYIISTMLENKCKFLSFLGKYTMEIYLLSYFILMPIKIFGNKYGFPYYSIICLELILGIGLPIIISKYVIRDNKVLNIILFGKKIARK